MLAATPRASSGEKAQAIALQSRVEVNVAADEPQHIVVSAENLHEVGAVVERRVIHPADANRLWMMVHKHHRGLLAVGGSIVS